MSLTPRRTPSRPPHPPTEEERTEREIARAIAAYVRETDRPVEELEEAIAWALRGGRLTRTGHAPVDLAPFPVIEVEEVTYNTYPGQPSRRLT